MTGAPPMKDRIIELLHSGKRSAEIVAILKDHGVTTGMVSGYRYRSGGHATFGRPPRSEIGTPINKRDPGKSTQPIVAGGGKALEKLGPRDCRWPVGTPGARGFHFCGHPIEPSRPYCTAHCRKAYKVMDSTGISCP